MRNGKNRRISGRLLPAVAAAVLSSAVAASALPLPSGAYAARNERSAPAQAQELLSLALTLTDEDLEKNEEEIGQLLEEALSDLHDYPAAVALIKEALAFLGSRVTTPEDIISLIEQTLFRLEAQEEEESAPGAPEDGEEEEIEDDADDDGEDGLPEFVQKDYEWSVLNSEVSVMVPSDWGNNLSDSAITSYSPANGSGAISPLSGTLQTAYVSFEGEDDPVGVYEDGIAKLNETSQVSAEDVRVAGRSGRRIQYLMTLGANQFECEAVYFPYEEMLYSVQMLQGNQRTEDFDGVFEKSAESFTLGVEENVKPEEEPEEPEEEPAEEPSEEPEEPGEESEDEPAEEPEEPGEEPEEKPAEEEHGKPEEESSGKKDDKPGHSAHHEQEETEEEPEDPEKPEEEPAEEPEEPEEEPEEEPAEKPEEPEEVPEEEPEKPEEEPEEEPEDEPQGPGLLDTFTYTVNGNTYAFPTRMSEVDEGDLPVDMDQLIKYEIHENQAEEGIFNELSNTAYFFTDGTLMGEMCGVSNIRGTEIPVSEGVLTHLTDLRGGMLLELPGGLKVGAPEETIFEAFPPFEDVKMDGVAGFIGNEFVYGCNVRSDGTHGYLLIRNDRPYYSTVSVICEDGVIREISFECIGSNRAKGVFLPE